MKTKLFILSALTLFILAFSGCGSTDEDKQMSEDILGYWQALDENGDPERNIPNYYFDTDDEGFTTLYGDKDEMHWEIIRGQLKVYYDKAPSYIIGNDKYNSRSLFQIHSLNQKTLNVTIYYHDGFQSELDFYRTEYTPE